MRRILLTAFVFFSLACFSVCVEEITLQDGTKITGKITEVTGDTFKVKTRDGEIQVPRDKIVSISFTEYQPKDAATAKRPDRGDRGNVARDTVHEPYGRISNDGAGSLDSGSGSSRQYTGFGGRAEIAGPNVLFAGGARKVRRYGGHILSSGGASVPNRILRL